MSNAPENYNTSKYICNNIISNNVYLNCDSLAKPDNKTSCYNIHCSELHESIYTPHNTPYKQSVNYIKQANNEMANAALIEDVAYTAPYQ